MTKPDGDQPKAPESKPGSMPIAKDDLKSLPLPEMEKKLGSSADGLTSGEARRQLEKCGPNTMPDTSVHPLRVALEKFWAPVPWMLEAAILLELVLGKYVEAAIIAGLLVFNAALGLFQESRAQATLAALKSRLALNASVRRDGAWKTVPAAELVPGDLVKLSLGGVVAADVKLTGGEVLLDQSMLTGESVPIEASPGVQTFAGALVRRGEAVAEVTATGPRTKFGRTAELVRTAHVVSSQQKAVLRVVRNLAAFNGVVIMMLVAYAYFLKMPLAEIVPLVLTAILASIPVALPATFTLAAALGARALAKLGVLPTRLSAVDEAGTTDVLCADKTGTLTQNALTVTTVRPMPGFDDAHVLVLAALASSDGGQDPVDGAIRSATLGKAVSDAPKLITFTPFDPAKKMSEATATDSTGGAQRIVKGAFAVVIGLAQHSPTATELAKELEGHGFRVLAVAAGPPTVMKLAGLIALSDPPRSDSAALVTELHGLGVRTVMVTGDAPATAAIVARAVGLDGAVCPPGPIPDNLHPEQFAVYAGVLPEDKYKLVKAFQKGGHTVGMCGDGANDAPALRQAQIGIAVSTATDVAKSAAGMVLTEPGLAGIVAAVKEGRVTFERILTYTLNSIIKKIVTVLFLVVGLIMTGHAILTPLLMVIVMITGDFLSMSLTTDNVRPSPIPNAWRIGNLTMSGVIMGICLLAFCTGVLTIGRFEMNLGTEALRTLAFVVLVFGSQATLYAIRQRRHLWGSRPSLWLVMSSVADIAIASTLAVGGIAMTPLPALVVAGTLAAAAAFAFVLDLVKVPVFARLGIAQSRRSRPLTHETVGIAKAERLPIMEPDAAQPRAPISKSGSLPITQDDLKSLPLREVEKRLGSSADGLSQAEAQKRLIQYGPNEIEEKETNPFLKFLTYFWGPIPWMIEVAVILSAVARHWPDFGIILLLLLANAVVGFWEEHQAGNAIAALKAKLAIKARVKRDGKWINPPARELVPGDVIRVRLGDIVPADARLLEGDPVEVDQAALTGESLPATRKSGDAVFSGSIIRQGEISALVYATGTNTYFGKTAQLVQEAHTVSHFQRAVLKIGDYLIILAVVLVAVIIATAIFRGDPILTTLQFALVLTVAAIPVAMPTVLSVTMAVGARLLAKKEAIVTRLSAIEELAGVDILCSDKTGTLTQNKLTLGDPFSVNDIPADQVILNAALASRADDKDTIDLAVLGGLKNDQALKGYEIIHFQPFDPVHKRTEATVKDADGNEFKVTKGAPQVILELAANAAQVKPAAEKAVNDFAARGFRSLGVARAEGEGEWQFLGVLPLFDPPRDDAKATIATARQMGVSVKMVTGDALAIAVETAKKLGMGTNILDASGFGDTKRHETAALAESIEKADGFAQVFPEHKFHIVDVLQQGGHIVGMTGDGVNDAPALKKADCGVAVSGATDAARAAAAIVLMTPGLSVIIDAIKESRKIFQRMNSYAIYRIAETLRVLLFMTLSILIFNFYPLTAVMIVMLALLNDGAILSIAYDNVHYKDHPESWNMRLVLGIATVLGIVGVVSAFGLFYIGERVLHLDRAHIQTLMYLKLSVAGHLTIFLTRTRGPFWSIRPARVLWVAVLGTQVLATLIAVYGLFMTPLGWGWALFVWGYAVAWFLVNDRVKLLAYRILDPVKGGSVTTRVGRAWIELRNPRAPAESPQGGQLQSAGTADQAAAGWVSTHWRIPAAAVILVVLAFGGGGWFYWSTHRTAAVHYATQKIELGAIVRTVNASGAVDPTATAPIGTRVSGVIQALSCAADTKVKAGQICAKIDPRPYQTVVDQGNADLAAAEVRLEKEKRDLAHAKTAFERASWRSKRRAISRKALDNLRRTYEHEQMQMKLDEATVAELQAALHDAETNLGDTDIIAPIDGTIVSRNVKIGQTVAAGAETPPLFLIAADLSVIQVDGMVSEDAVGEIKLGDKASFTVNSFPDRSFAGEVTHIGPSPQTIQNAATYDVVITASNPELLLKPGMTAAIKIVVDRRDGVLRAPDQALRYSPAGRAAASGSSGARTPLAGWPQVSILRGGRPTAVPVQLGLQDGAFTEIVKGDLKPGDDLIISESGSRVNH